MTQLSMKRDAALKGYLNVVAALPRVDAVRRLDLACEWRDGNADAGRQLMECYLPMVVAEAAARRGLGASFETLLATGNRALAKALPDAVQDLIRLDATVRHSIIAALKEQWVRTHL